MSRDKNYQKLLNAKEWKTLRAWYLRKHPLCELCEEKGLVVSAVDVHHIVPVESAKGIGGTSTVEAMRELCYNPNNLQALCISCHANLHRQQHSHTKDAHKQREAERLDRWKARHRPGASFNLKAK